MDPARELTVRCPACGMAEAFDIAQLPCGQRALPADALVVKLRCRCGSRQRLQMQDSDQPAERHDPPRAQLWWA